MSYTVLARKYRPQKFSEVIGQEHVTRTLQNALEQGRTAHGYIFSGHRGIGKTTVARILAAALNCRSSLNTGNKPVAEPCGICESCTEIRAGNAVDVIEIDAATNRGIDEIRELREAARYKPARDRFKIYILDEAHQITDAAFNALLKTLEEPPDHIVFMLATTQPEDVPQTIRSRCQHFSFRAVKFDDIVGQLRDLVGREKIEADDDALALLAEAGDGSMRDALSILDQAIASSSGKITADSVRNLVGAAPAHVLENVMQAVARGASDDVLRQVDHLISEGHSPIHFARQMVRFLRNATVAKIAGKDSSLLQISSEERERVERVAELFGEEDLTRHLQIMLRTHGELGYKQEQRFHLELGLLKMAHAQRLLPIEQLLSDVASSSDVPRSGGSGPSALPMGEHPMRKIRLLGEPEVNPPTSRPSVSPFDADSARKGGPRQESASDQNVSGRQRGIGAGSPPARVVMGSAAPADLNELAPEVHLSSQPATQVQATPIVPQVLPQATPSVAPIEKLRSAVVQTLMDGNQRILVSMLEAGEWSVEGNEVVIKVSESQTVVDMSLGGDARRLAIASASGVLGRAVKLRIVPGSTLAAEGKSNGNAVKSNGTNAGVGGRGRAEQDAVVRRLQEKFGAEIRTVIDYKEKR
ncbi:MAG TPA: DNA polymerase III subunit gamma/tau [Candidatus Dormibacteraeota bacterium]|jgi:DNA polymerase-3 subunit gamma/tau|nr:DNA polymerase III subunit gamma/tau [Candidatus Dormibacteraeota bacterium]